MRQSSSSRRRFARCSSSIATSAIRPRRRKSAASCCSITAKGVRKGGESGPAIVPGKPEKSLLIGGDPLRRRCDRNAAQGKAARRGDRRPRSLGEDGRARPARCSAGHRSRATPGRRSSATRRDWWSLQAGPEAGRAARRRTRPGPISRSIASSWPSSKRRAWLRPPPADPRTLVRRLSLVLTGLPPTAGAGGRVLPRLAMPAESRRQRSKQAASIALLGSPHFGERWARHWMDVVRFTETHGNEWNYEVHHAWRYRDYLIRAFNADVPYDQFVREHIAGDLLPQPRWNEQERFNESVIGTALLPLRRGQPRRLHQPAADRLRPGRQPDRHADQGVSGDDRGLCPLPRSQARRRVDARLLRPARHPAQLAAGEPHDRRAGGERSRRSQRLRELKTEIRAASWPTVWLGETRRGRPATCWRREPGRRSGADAAELADGLDPQRLEKWVAALAAEKLPLEDPLEPWRRSPSPAAERLQTARMAEAGRAVRARRAPSGAEFNERRLRDLRRFPHWSPADWQVGGQGLAAGGRGRERRLRHRIRTATRSSRPSCRPATSRTAAVGQAQRHAPLAGAAARARSTSASRSMGQRSSAVRLVSNNCQLNYKNYRALTSDDLHVGDVLAARRPRQPADLRRADDDVRQSRSSPTSSARSAATRRTTACRGRRRPRIRARTSASRGSCCTTAPEPPEAGAVAILRPLFAGDAPTIAGRRCRLATQAAIEAALARLGRGPGHRRRRPLARRAACGAAC